MAKSECQGSPYLRGCRERADGLGTLNTHFPHTREATGCFRDGGKSYSLNKAVVAISGFPTSVPVKQGCDSSRTGSVRD